MLNTINIGKVQEMTGGKYISSFVYQSSIKNFYEMAYSNLQLNSPNQ